MKKSHALKVLTGGGPLRIDINEDSPFKVRHVVAHDGGLWLFFKDGSRIRISCPQDKHFRFQYADSEPENLREL